MSKAALKKSLGAMTKSEIIETVCELYEVRREAKDYLDYWIDPNPDRALLEFKETVDKMFFYSTGKTRSQPSATDLRRMVKYFSTLVFDSEKTAELLLHIADRQYQWVTRKSGEWSNRRRPCAVPTTMPATMSKGLPLRRFMDCASTI